MNFPEGYDAEEVIRKLNDLAKNDFNPHSKRMWGHIYYAGLKDVVELARKAYMMYMDKTMLDFTCFPSLLRMEREVVRMTASLLHGDEETAGNFTYGGTESIYGVPSTHHLIPIQTTPYSKQIANSSSILTGHNHIT